ncbi:MAG: ABC transporter ATP-binding protein [Ahrensia sp.]
MSNALVEIKNLTRTFDVSKPFLNRIIEREGKQFLRAVDNVSLSIRKGETYALVGESGSGKSTIAKMVVGLLPATSGEIRFDGTLMNTQSSASMTALRARFQMIFQSPFASLNPRWKVRDIIAEPMRTFGTVEAGAPMLRRVDELLELVGLGAADGAKFPHEFSGGQRQRIAIARALSSNPEFIVCDEPTSALDVSVQAQILNLMRDLQDDLGLTYLFISHDLSVVRHMANRIGVLYLGALVEDADAKQLFINPQHPYTKMLLDAVPDLDMDGKPRAEVLGEIPNPINPPSGCTFHPRCPIAFDKCKQQVPAMVETPNGHAKCWAVEGS